MGLLDTPYCMMTLRQVLFLIPLAVGVTVVWMAVITWIENRKLQEKEIVICAAVKCIGGRVVVGHRHSNCYAYMKGTTPPLDELEDGFLTSRNRFVGRDEALRLQLAAGIRPAEGEYGRHLFSEDIYHNIK